MGSLLTSAPCLNQGLFPVVLLLVAGWIVWVRVWATDYYTDTAPSGFNVTVHVAAFFAVVLLILLSYWRAVQVAALYSQGGCA